jgi:tyrosine-specific transport protein
MKKKLFAAAMFIAGTSVGAGMLALPIKTYQIGFLPSLAAMLFVWSIMLASAFFMLEATLTQPKGSNLATIAQAAYGKYGKYIITLLYLALLYSLNAAYIASLNKIILSYFANKTVGSIISLSLFIGFLMFIFYGIKHMAAVNKILVLALGIIYILAMLQLSNDVSFSLLSHIDQGFLEPLPIITTAFGYQIIIPSIADYCERNVTTIKKSIWIGSLIPLLIYIIWQICTLGVLPIDSAGGLQAISQSDNPVVLLTASLKNHAYLIDFQELIKNFTTLAVATSFIGVSVSLFDFCKDSFKTKQHNNILISSLILIFTFLPSIISSFYFPKIFISALEYGGVLVAILLGLMPATLAIKLRSIKSTQHLWKIPNSNIWIIWIICGIIIILTNPLITIFS